MTQTETNPQETPEFDGETTAADNEHEAEIIAADDILDESAAAADASEHVNIEIDDEILEEAGPEERVQILEAQVADLNDKLLRTMAEMENVRRRAQREKEDASKFAIANFAKEMLTVSDNMTRAFASIEGDNAKGSEVDGPFKSFVEGVRMTEADLLKTLERLGLKKIEPLGQRFDANLHEALFEFEDKEQPAGTVAQVLEQGFTLNGRLLRPAKVGITKGGPKASPQPIEDAPAEPDDLPNKDSQTAYENKGSEPGGQLNEEL